MKVEIVDLSPLIASATVLFPLFWLSWLGLRGAGNPAPPAPPAAGLGEPVTQDRGESAAVLYALMLSQDQWVHRRIESFELLDDKALRRVVSLDFTLPSRLPSAGDESLDAGLKALDAIPLTLLLKRPLRNFDLWDEDDHPLPLLTKQQNADIVGDALIVVGEALLAGAGDDDPTLPASIRRDLRHFARRPTEEALGQVEAWEQARAQPGAEHHAIWATLLGDASYSEFLKGIAESYVLLAATEPQVGTRRLLKFSYEEPFAHSGNRLTRRLASFGWWHYGIAVDTPGVTAAASYHLEAAAPEELQLGKTRLVFSSNGDDPPPTDEITDAEPSMRRAHLYTSDNPPSISAEGHLPVLARPQGLVRAGFFAVLLLMGLLGGGLWRLHELQSQVDSATALLLIVPSVLAAYLVRPGEHALTTRVLAGIRGLLLVSAIASVTAVAALVGELDRATLTTVWTVALGLTGGSSFVLLISNIVALATARGK